MFQGNGVEGVIGDLRVSVLRSGPNGKDAGVIIKMNKTLEPVKTIFYERLY